MSRLSIRTKSQAQELVDSMYAGMERRIAASPSGLCPIDITLSFLNLCHAQSCGKCTPCRIGLGKLSALLKQVLDGGAPMETLDRIKLTAPNIVAAPPPAPWTYTVRPDGVVLNYVRGSLFIMR